MEVQKLEADGAELEKSISQLHSIHQEKIERKDAFCEVEKIRVATKLQASFNAKLPSLYAQQYQYGYWDGYIAVEQLVGGDCESPTEDVVELTHDAKRDHVEPSYT